MGSNKILLLSHESVVPGKDPVNLNVEGDTSTIYGLDQNQIFGNLFPNTEPMVRGEKLKEFLTLITSFLTTHTHAYPGTPPTTISYSGVGIDDIEQSFQNFSENIFLYWLHSKLKNTFFIVSSLISFCMSNLFI
jgi:hypothetical protein